MAKCAGRLGQTRNSVYILYMRWQSYESALGQGSCRPFTFGDRFPMDTVCGTMAVVRYVIRHLGRFLSTWIIRCPRAFLAGEEEKKRVGWEGRRVFIHGVAARLALPDGQARFHRECATT